MIQHSELNGHLQGMRLTASCPSITHLLFADDSLLFCQANSHDCHSLATILDHYAKVYGQKINFDKSSMIFGQRVIESRRRRLHRILNIHRVGGGGKYLGLPEQFQGKKTELFAYLTKSVAGKTKGWYNQFLSTAGKEILIKSVALATPVYSMNCFMIPKSVCDDITSVLTEFWWGKTNGKRKIPWVAWKWLGIPKKEGGLGFRDLHTFNKALLAKQAWRIYQNATSLLARVYKGRYHKRTKFLDSTCAKQVSHGWRSGKDLLKLGLRKQIGDGTSLKLWEDNWLPSLPPRPPVPLSLDALATYKQVEQLWLPDSKEWDIQKISAAVMPEDIDLVQSIFLPQSTQTDLSLWAYTRDGTYSVRSGYWLATHSDHHDDLIQPPVGSVALKKAIWEL